MFLKTLAAAGLAAAATAQATADPVTMNVAILARLTVSCFRLHRRLRLFP